MVGAPPGHEATLPFEAKQRKADYAGPTVQKYVDYMAALDEAFRATVERALVDGLAGEVGIGQLVAAPRFV